MRMLMTMVVVVVVVATVGGCDLTDLLRPPPGLAPAGTNCSQRVVELLLLRQEMQLARLVETEATMAATLATLANTVTELRDAVVAKQEFHDQLSELPEKEKNCSSPWTIVGDNCLLLAVGDRLIWAEGQNYCKTQGGDFATFSDANTFAEFIGFINSVNPNNEAVDVFVGGGDEAMEGVWRWVTGELMPRGPPFWGSTDGYKPEPGNGKAGNCAVLWHQDGYYLHDVGCGHRAAPLCQKTLL